MTTPNASAVSPAPPPVAWIPFVFILLAWLPTMLRSSTQWELSPQYYYGWAVPLLAAYLIYERFLVRPEPQTATRKGWVAGLMILLALPQLPLRLIGEASSTSGLVSWAMALIATGISLGFLYLFGGRPWLRHFFAPILFLLVAVPWPGQFEQFVVQGLMRLNAQIATEIINAAGVPAIARGNVIEVPTGLLGVNEACSGIRSLQSTFMAAAFLALLYRLTARGCLLLMAAGVALAFVCNVVRTVFLSWQGAFHGIAATEKWHDSAGFAILGVVLVGLWLISHALDRHTRRASPAA